MSPTMQEAQKFFAELELASQGARDVAAGSSVPSPWGDAAFSGKPIGCVMHYTAGGSAKGSIDFLCRVSWESKASAHVVIGRTREEWSDKFVRKGGMVDQLPASVVQLRHPTQTAWHSTWANRQFFGVELACMGEVRKKDGQLVGPNGDWTEKVTDPQSVISAAGRLWENFTAPQMQTAIRVAQYYSALSGGFCPSNIIGHEQAQGIKTPERIGCDKRDLGVWVNMPAFRQCVSGAKDLSQFSLQPRPAPDAKLFETASGSGAQIDAHAAGQMEALGYHIVRPPSGRVFSVADNIISATIFQRMAGLKPDGVLGPRSIEGLAWRMRDRWLGG